MKDKAYQWGRFARGLGLALIVSLVSACATASRSTQVKKTKAHSSRSDNFSLYSAKSLDRKILRQGKKSQGGDALTSY